MVERLVNDNDTLAWYNHSQERRCLLCIEYGAEKKYNGVLEKYDGVYVVTIDYKCGINPT